MDVRYINPFIHSVCHIFETMCRTKVTVGKPLIKQGNDPATDVSGIIGFSGDAAGSVVLHFAEPIALTLASRFAGTPMTSEAPDFADAIGELANMVAGNAKAQFEGLNIAISLPNVILGAHHRVAVPSNAPRLLIPCETEAGLFHVEVGMVPTKDCTIRTEQQTTTGVFS